MRNKEYSWYLLSNAPGFGAKSIHYIYRNLLANNLSINDLFDLGLNELQRLFPEIGRGKLSRADFACFSQLDADEKLYDDFEKLKLDGVAIIGLDDDRYPKFVLENMRDNAPPILYCKGYLPLLQQKGVSIVGSRDAGDFEIALTQSIAQKLAENGTNVISGYAKGVDTSAHLGALEAQGTTTMVLSFGINHVTVKREFRDLDIEKNGLFVTQFAPYEKFSGQNAMIRNKLVCAMSEAIVVIKSGPEKDTLGKMSGTFDAGKSALEMGLPVFVLSPEVLKPTPQGNIDLIKLGGMAFSNVVDIVTLFKEHLERERVGAGERRDTKEKKEPANKPTKPHQIRLFD